MQSPMANAISAKMFEKRCCRSGEIEFLSWSSIELGLYLLDESRCNSSEISAFGNVLSDKLVCVLHEPLLSRAV